MMALTVEGRVDAGQAEATDVSNRCMGEKPRDYHYHLCHMGSMTQGEQAKNI